MMVDDGKYLTLSSCRRFLSTWDEPLLVLLTRLTTGSLSISGNFPDYDTLSSVGAVSGSLPTVELYSSGHWLYDFYVKSLLKIESRFTADDRLVETYLSSVFPLLSDEISRQLYQLASHCHTLFHGEGKTSENETMASQAQSFDELNFRDPANELNVIGLANQFNIALREVLLRIHLGSLLIGELKWQSNTLLFSDLVRGGKEDELVSSITSQSVEDDLKRRLKTSLEVIWKDESICVGLKGLSGSEVNWLKKEIITFFGERIVSNTKKGQCEFIKLHVFS